MTLPEGELLFSNSFMWLAFILFAVYRTGRRTREGGRKEKGERREEERTFCDTPLLPTDLLPAASDPLFIWGAGIFYHRAQIGLLLGHLQNVFSYVTRF